VARHDRTRPGQHRRVTRQRPVVGRGGLEIPCGGDQSEPTPPADTDHPAPPPGEYTSGASARYPAAAKRSLIDRRSALRPVMSCSTTTPGHGGGPETDGSGTARYPRTPPGRNSI